MRLLFLLTLLIFPAIAHAQHTKDTPKTIQKKLKEKKAVLIDVREQSEWDNGHLKDAKLLPLSKIDKMEDKQLLKLLPKDKIAYLHCKSGGRCLLAAEALKKKGYNVVAVKEGYEDLLKAGFEKAKPTKKV